MLLAILASSLLQVPVQVDGLGAGERSASLTVRDRAVGAVEARAGRVVDAFTGRPVVGASVEAWSEEIARAGSGLRRVGEARSDHRGQFQLRSSDGGLRADKLRVRAGGYLTFAGTLGDETLIELFPAPSEGAPRIEVLDLRGRPIVGARITSTYSCAHDVPAFELVTDAFGAAVLLEYGLQDHQGELRVRARGFRGVKYLRGSRVLGLAYGGVHRVVLGRGPILRANLLDRDGKPLQNTPLKVLDGDGHHVLFTDEQGHFELAERFDGHEVSLYALRGGREDYLFGGPLPSDGKRWLAPSGGHDLEEGYAPASLRVRSSRTSYGRPLIVDIFHVAGFHGDARALEEVPIDLRAGDIVLEYGRPFRDLLPGRVELSLQAGVETLLELEPAPAPWLEVRVPPGESERLMIEAGDDSTEIGVDGEGVGLVQVPVECELVVVSLGRRARRLVLAPIPLGAGPGNEAEPARVADLTSDACLAPELLSDAGVDPEQRVTFTVTGPAGELRVHGAGKPEVREVAPGRFQVEASPGARLLVCLESPGHGLTGARVTAGEVEDVALSPTPLASIEIQSPRAFRVEPPFHLAFGQDTRDLADVAPSSRSAQLHPGPALIVLAFEDGGRLALDLNLTPGEQRALTLN